MSKEQGPPPGVCGEYMGTLERIAFYCMLKPGHDPIKEPHNDLLEQRMRKNLHSLIAEHERVKRNCD